MSRNVFNAFFSVDHSKENRWKHKGVSYAFTYTIIIMCVHIFLNKYHGGISVIVGFYMKNASFRA